MEYGKWAGAAVLAAPAVRSRYSVYYSVHYSVTEDSGQDLRVLLLHCLKAVRIESQRLQDRRCNLRGLDRAGDRLCGERRFRQQHDHVGVVMREAAMLGQL